MAYCLKCGAQIADGAAFCGSCGAPAGASSQASLAGAPASYAAVPAGATAQATSGAPAMSPNVAGLVAYLLGPLTGIFLLVVEPYKGNKFVRFHAFQSIFVSAVYLVIMFLWSGLASAMFSISFSAFWSLAYFVWWLIRLAFLALWLFLMYKAYNNQPFELPFIGPIARKQAG